MRACVLGLRRYRKERLPGGVARSSLGATWWISGALFMAMGASASIAGAQVASSFGELLGSRALRSGDGVYVTSTSGRRIKADLLDMSLTALTLEDERRTWTFADADILRIDRQDSLDNGAAIGLLAGVATAYVACKMQRYSEQCVYGVVYIGYPAIAVGTVIGAIVDANRHETVYQRSAPARVTLSPVVRTGGVGARLSVCW